MNRYNPLEIEKKWQTIWAETDAFRASDSDKKSPKIFLAEMFPYPSGAGLHVGHVRNFSIVDALARFYSQQRLNVLRPFGYDTFGLPAENYAIKTGVSPKVATEKNINNFRTQAKRLGFAIDWSREINTSDPEYYRWTQWCFLQLYKKGLAYQKESYQWWCPVDKTVLANEQVEGGKCWRCGTEVEKKNMRQWFFRITAYADELLHDIDSLDWPEKIKTAQKNWIGRSEGAEVKFDNITVFTTRPDTIFGATFLVLAPEHPLIPTLVTEKTKAKVEDYCKSAIKKSEIERQENKEKTGVFTGAYVKNPVSGEDVPVWVSDYVLMNYGTGAIMAVPAHDERDFAFAEKFDLPIKKVIEKPEGSKDDDACYHGEGILANSGDFSGTDSATAREAIVKFLQKSGRGEKKVAYKMRDWLISRQRYWGCPIPIAYDKAGHPHPIPEDQLPVMLPEISDYKPDESGRSALAKAKDWLKIKVPVTNPKTGKTHLEEMTRETDTLDGYACSSWYLWRYVSPHDNNHAWDPEQIAHWAPTDVYCGGDHAVAHLLYIRFWCKFFADEGYLPFREPIKKLLYNGYINAPDGKKMSKSKGNVIDPLDVIDSGYGADTLRTYELFIGPYNEDAAWSTEAIGGVYRFLNRCWTLVFGGSKLAANQQLSELCAGRCRAQAAEPRKDGRSERGSENADERKRVRNYTTKKVTTDLHRASFNTAVAALMEYVNALYKTGADKEDLIVLGKLLKPFAPHLACEILEYLKSDDEWPTWDESLLVSDTVTLVVQINGKLRARIELDKTLLDAEDDLLNLVLKDENVKKYVKSPSDLKKHILIKRTNLLNLVI